MLAIWGCRQVLSGVTEIARLTTQQSKKEEKELNRRQTPFKQKAEASDTAGILPPSAVDYDGAATECPICIMDFQPREWCYRFTRNHMAHEECWKHTLNSVNASKVFIAHVAEDQPY